MILSHPRPLALLVHLWLKWLDEKMKWNLAWKLIWWKFRRVCEWRSHLNRKKWQAILGFVLFSLRHFTSQWALSLSLFISKTSSTRRRNRVDFRLNEKWMSSKREANCAKLLRRFLWLAIMLFFCFSFSAFFLNKFFLCGKSLPLLPIIS